MKNKEKQTKEIKQILSTADIADILMTSSEGKYDTSKLMNPDPIIAIDEINSVQFNERKDGKNSIIDKQLKKNLRYGRNSKKRQKFIDEKYLKTSKMICDLVQASIDGLKFGNDDLNALALRLESVLDDLNNYAFEFVSERGFTFTATSLFNVVFNEKFKDIDTHDKLNKAISNVNKKDYDIDIRLSEVTLLVDTVVNLVHERNNETIEIQETAYPDAIYVNEDWQAFTPVEYKDLNEEKLYNMTVQLYDDVMDLTDQVIGEFNVSSKEASTSAFRLMSNIEQMFTHNVPIACRAYNNFYSKPHDLYVNNERKAIEIMDELNGEIVKLLQHDAIENLDDMETLDSEEVIELTMDDLDSKNYNSIKLKDQSKLEDGFIKAISRCISQTGLINHIDISDMVSEMVGKGFTHIGESLVKISKLFRQNGLTKEANILFNLGTMRLDFDYVERFNMGLNKYYRSPVEYFNYMTKILFSGKRLESNAYDNGSSREAFKNKCDIPSVWDKYVDAYLNDSCAA